VGGAGGQGDNRKEGERVTPPAHGKTVRGVALNQGRKGSKKSRKMLGANQKQFERGKENTCKKGRSTKKK